MVVNWFWPTMLTPVLAGWMMVSGPFVEAVFHLKFDHICRQNKFVPFVRLIRKRFVCTHNIWKTINNATIGKFKSIWLIRISLTIWRMVEKMSNKFKRKNKKFKAIRAEVNVKAISKAKPHLIAIRSNWPVWSGSLSTCR